MKRRYLPAFSILTALLMVGCFQSGAPAEDITPTATIIEPQVVSPTPVPTVEETLALPLDTSAAASAHPLSIASLRARSYEGSDFVVEQILEPGINYSRAIVSYQSDGLKIYALLTVPLSPKPPAGYPVIIFNHGYIPPDEYRTTERYIAYVDAFARSDYIVIRPDYRGHGFSEGEPESAYGSPGYVIDVLNVLASARRYPDADPTRIGMWGHSMGGYITIRAMVADQGIRAGVIWAGVVASYPELFQTWFRGGSGSRRSWLSDAVTQFGTVESNPGFWNALSANSFLDDLSGPVQIHHGLADATVPYDYSIQLDEQIRTAGGTVELYLYPNDDHNIAANRDGALALSVVFFNRYVKGSYE
ncbi:MAG: alpha/beta fold hydrolase [Chloroflexota bacterium]|nr:alpha/beta fold hydrolase [Chloroflexota bacterium]